MPNIASILKEEIARVARKELRASTDRLKQITTQHRSELAALKRRITELEQSLAKLRKGAARAQHAAVAAEAEPEGKAFRYSAKGLTAQRKRLGLSAAQLARLLDVSVQSVYKWEEGAARPRARHFPAIAELRAMGRREVAARLNGEAGAAGEDAA